MFSMAIFSFAENVEGGQGFVDIVSNIPAAQSFTFNVNGGPSTQDFVVVSAAGLLGQVTFPAGQTTVRVPFNINNDEVGLEDLEMYVASLSLTPEAIAGGVSLAAISQADVQVVDDDGMWSLYVVANGNTTCTAARILRLYDIHTLGFVAIIIAVTINIVQVLAYSYCQYNYCCKCSLKLRCPITVL